MLTCITCSKQRSEDDGGGGGGARGTPSTKEAVKSLTAQIKDMALKVSGSSKLSKPNTPGSYRVGQRPFSDFDSISEGFSYLKPGSLSSKNPAWDYTRHDDTRFTGLFGGDRTPGGLSISSKATEVVVDEVDEPKEWTAQVEPGIQITFISLPHGGNDLKRMRFSRDLYDKWEAQRWWAENYDRIMELYNVRRFNQQALDTPARSENGRDSSYSRLGSPRESSMMTPSANREWAKNYYNPPGNHFPSNFHSSMDAPRATNYSRDDASVTSEMESEWIEEDEPGVYITIRQLTDGTRELRRVRFSRETFGEVKANIWWDANKERIQAQYL